MTDKEFWIYVALGVWAVINLITFYFTKDEYEFYDPKKPEAHLPWYKLVYFACFSTVIAQARLWWDERKQTGE